MAAALLASHARGSLLDEARKTTPAQLAVQVQRTVLDNGLVLLLASAPVWWSTRARPSSS